MGAVTDRMKSDYMYSVSVVFNTFPLPPRLADADTSALKPLAEAVLDTRSAHASATLADLYGPDLMPANVRRAHQALDWRCRPSLPREALHVGALNASSTCSRCTSACRHRAPQRRRNRRSDGAEGHDRTRRGRHTVTDVTKTAHAHVREQINRTQVWDGTWNGCRG